LTAPPPPLTRISLPERKAASLHLFAAIMQSSDYLEAFENCEKLNLKKE
jgi:hypothetical protein